jgi:hypothetical protein
MLENAPNMQLTLASKPCSPQRENTNAMIRKGKAPCYMQEQFFYSPSSVQVISISFAGKATSRYA